MNNRVLFCIIFLLFGHKTAQAQIIIDSQDFNSISAKNQLSVFTDSSKSMTINDIMKAENQKRFHKIASESPNFGFDPNNHWLQFSIENRSSSTIKLNLRTMAAFFDKLEIYSVSKDSIEQNLDFNWRTIPSKRKIISRFPVAQIELLPSQQKTIYIKAKKDVLKVVVSVEISSPKFFLQNEKREDILYGILIVFMLLSSFTSFVIYLIFKKKVFLFHLIQTFFAALNMLSATGYSYFVADRQIPYLIDQGSYNLSLFGIVIGVLLFTYSFFNCPRYEKKWLKNCQMAAIAFAFSYFLLSVYDLNFIKYFRLDFTINIFILVLFLVIYDGLKRKDRNAIFYIIVSTPIVISILISALHSSKLIERPFYYYYYAPIAFFIEQIALLVGILHSLFKSQQEKIFIQANIKTQLIETQEAERSRIASDLHDDLGGTLALLKTITTDEKSIEIVNKAIFDLRNISRDLVPPDFEQQGLVPALELFIRRLQKTTNIAFSYIVFGEIHSFFSDQELNIYRIVTELANNVVKHSSAGTATIQLIFHDKYLFVSVEDDGEFIAKATQNQGLGLRNIDARLNYLKARKLNTNTRNNYAAYFEVPYE